MKKITMSLDQVTESGWYWAKDMRPHLDNDWEIVLVEVYDQEDKTVYESRNEDGYSIKRKPFNPFGHFVGPLKEPVAIKMVDDKKDLDKCIHKHCDKKGISKKRKIQKWSLDCKTGIGVAIVCTEENKKYSFDIVFIDDEFIISDSE